MPEIDAQNVLDKIKTRVKSPQGGFNEEKHCLMILKIMSDKSKGTISAFCVEALIGEKNFYKWLQKSELFQECYALGKMMSRENWEDEGRRIKNIETLPGSVNNEFDYWKMVGWSRFGIGKVNKVRLGLDPDSTPNQHYAQLIKQASEGDFTAGEIKQLMEAINVGLNTHEVFALQQELDQLKADLAIMNENSNADNSFANKGTTKKD